MLALSCECPGFERGRRRRGDAFNILDNIHLKYIHKLGAGAFSILYIHVTHQIGQKGGTIPKPRIGNTVPVSSNYNSIIKWEIS